jgi:predicted PurR-regulated permease PerM
MAGSRPTHLLCLQQKEQQTQSPVKIRTDIAYWAHLLITLSILTALLFWAQTLLKPIAFAIIIALLFRPLCSKLERIGLPSTIAILIILISSVALIAAILSLFSAQLYFLFQDLQDFEQNILQIINRLQEIIYRNLPISQKEIDVFIFESRNQILSESSSLLGPTLGASGNFLASAGLTLVYVFFFLLYRKSIFAFILMTQIENKRDDTRDFLTKVNKVIIRYFMGLLIVIAIMGTLNSIGLWIIGVEHAILFGFFAAALTIIPYIGTYIGGALPVLYVILNKGEMLPAVYVTAWFIVVQLLESNWITPRIIGNQVSVNALFAFMALILGGLIWGIAGMILFIPFTAVLKILFDHSESFKSLGVLLGSEFSQSGSEPKIPTSQD